MPPLRVRWSPKLSHHTTTVFSGHDTRRGFCWRRAERGGGRGENDYPAENRGASRGSRDEPLLPGRCVPHRRVFLRRLRYISYHVVVGVCDFPVRLDDGMMKAFVFCNFALVRWNHLTVVALNGAKKKGEFFYLFIIRETGLRMFVIKEGASVVTATTPPTTYIPGLRLTD